MFDAFPTYPRFRTLHLTDPLTRGEDVFGLQTALAAVGFDPGTVDGILGKKTVAAIRRAQAALNLTIDGLAGGETQKAVALELANGVALDRRLPAGALRGQLEHESAFRLGNYSPIRPDGSYDAGVAQRNTQHTPARDGFTVPTSIDALGEAIAHHHALFVGVPDRRRWALAQGAWNAPAYACFIANEEGAHVPKSLTLRPGDAARRTFEAYVSAVSLYLVV